MILENAKKFIYDSHPDCEVKWIDKGQMNYIAVVDEKFVYKFPKKPENWNSIWNLSWKGKNTHNYSIIRN